MLSRVIDIDTSKVILRILGLTIFVTIILSVGIANAYLIEDGAKDMDDVTDIGEKALDILKNDYFQGILFCYCRTRQLEPHKMSYWVIGISYDDAKAKNQALFNLNVSLVQEFGCIEKPVMVDLKPGDNLAKIPSYHMQSHGRLAKKQGLEIFMKAMRMQQQSVNQKDLRQVLYTYEESLRKFREALSTREIGLALDQIGTVYQLMWQPQQALLYKEQALTVCQDLNDFFCEACTLNSIGLVYKRMGQYQKAIEVLRRSLSVSQKSGRSDVEKNTLSYIQNIDNLLYEKIDVDQRDNKGKTPLMDVCIDGHVELVKLFLSKGSNINSANENGQTALMMAAANGNIEIVKILLQNGANLNQKDKLGNSALNYALENEHSVVTQLLESKK